MNAATTYAVPASLTQHSARSVLEAGRQAIASGARIIDLAALSELDSAAVATLLAWLREAGRNRVQLEWRHPPQALQTLLSLYGVEELITPG